jgi:acyl carrier protein
MVNPAPSPMTQAEILAVLTDLFREILDNSLIELKPTDKDSDIPGFDSAKKVHLVLSVEDRFGIQLRSCEIDDLRSVADWTRIIRMRSGTAA